jgi:hypothetical protein
MVIDPRLDRLEHFDHRSLQYPASDLFATSVVTTKMWTIPESEPVIDQGPDGACVGFGVTNELRFEPVAIPGLDAKWAKETIYWGAQHADEWPGGSYPGAAPQYEGTSVLAGVKTAVGLGYYTQYRWAFSEDDLALTIGQIGPAVIGVPWYSGMFQPNSRGYLNLTGTIQGGHCVLVIGVDVRASNYTIYNSWGPTWGDRGRAKLRRQDMRRLLTQGGEACVITGRANPSSR